jgi:hypothetical protein
MAKMREFDQKPEILVHHFFFISDRLSLALSTTHCGEYII